MRRRAYARAEMGAEMGKVERLTGLCGKAYGAKVAFVAGFGGQVVECVAEQGKTIAVNDPLSIFGRLSVPEAKGGGRPVIVACVLEGGSSNPLRYRTRFQTNLDFWSSVKRPGPSAVRRSAP